MRPRKKGERITMAIHEAIVYEGQKPTAAELADLERASKLPINYDDIPRRW